MNVQGFSCVAVFCTKRPFIAFMICLADDQTLHVWILHFRQSWCQISTEDSWIETPDERVCKVHEQTGNRLAQQAELQNFIWFLHSANHERKKLSYHSCCGLWELCRFYFGEFCVIPYWQYRITLLNLKGSEPNNSCWRIFQSSVLTKPDNFKGSMTQMRLVVFSTANNMLSPRIKPVTRICRLLPCWVFFVLQKRHDKTRQRKAGLSSSFGKKKNNQWVDFVDRWKTSRCVLNKLSGVISFLYPACQRCFWQFSWEHSDTSRNAMKTPSSNLRMNPSKISRTT